MAEYVPATMLDPKALGTALEFHILTFIEHCSGTQGRRRCLAAGVLDIWHGTDHEGTARNIWHGTDPPESQESLHGEPGTLASSGIQYAGAHTSKLDHGCSAM